VVLEHKQELVAVSLVTLVVQHVQGLLLSQELVVLQSLTADGEDLEDGVHVQ
jgi:hypothetical protein